MSEKPDFVDAVLDPGTPPRVRHTTNFIPPNADEMIVQEKDDGSAERAAEIAAGWIGCAWFRGTNGGGKNGGELMLALADAARSHITAEQWKTLGLSGLASETVELSEVVGTNEDGSPAV